METSNKIILCDDSEENLKVLAGILKPEGYKLALARNIAEMMSVISEFMPTLILLDVMMPDMNGFDGCRLLKKNELYRDIPVIFITAKIETTDIVEGFNAGGVDYISKPFNSAELLVRVNSQIDLQNARELIKNQAIDLQKLNQTKDQVFSIISHDMRAPLASLKMLLQVIQKVDICERKDFVRETLKLVEVSAEETYQLLDNLLIWSKGQMGRLKCNPVKFSLIEIVNQNLRLFEFQLLNKKLTVQFNPADINMVMADEDMIKTIFRNILSNAIKFSDPETNIQIEIKKDNKQIILSVANIGKVIDSDTCVKIFSDTEYITTPGTKGEKGNGLGMKICKRFIELNNGSIWAKSNANQGSTFYFSLPFIN